MLRTNRQVLERQNLDRMETKGLRKEEWWKRIHKTRDDPCEALRRENKSHCVFVGGAGNVRRKDLCHTEVEVIKFLEKGH